MTKAQTFTTGTDTPADLSAERLQYAALCYRVSGGAPEVLLITSRDTGRWVIPKGWPIDGLSPAESAAREAFEEAGALGRVSEIALGLYGYPKQLDTGEMVHLMVAVFPLAVEACARDWPERGQRRLKWLSPRKAAAKVNEPELRALLRAFRPPAGKGQKR